MPSPSTIRIQLVHVRGCRRRCEIVVWSYLSYRPSVIARVSPAAASQSTSRVRASVSCRSRPFPPIPAATTCRTIRLAFSPLFVCSAHLTSRSGWRAGISQPRHANLIGLDVKPDTTRLGRVYARRAYAFCNRTRRSRSLSGAATRGIRHRAGVRQTSSRGIGACATLRAPRRTRSSLSRATTGLRAR